MATQLTLDQQNSISVTEIKEKARNLPEHVKRGPATKFVRVSDRVIEQLIQRNLAPVDAVPTPFALWNRACGGDGGKKGLARGWYVTIGGATGQGKSLLLANVIHSALQHGETVLLMSLEMGLPTVLTRLLAVVSGLPIEQLERGDKFSQRAMRQAWEHLKKLPGTLIINEKPISRLGEIRETIQVMHEYAGCRFVALDYLQLVQARTEAEMHERVREISTTVMTVTSELEITTVALSQYNRVTSSQTKEKPRPQGLIGGSSLENDSHQVLLLDHTYYKREPGSPFADTNLILAKNRHGPTGDIPIRWDYRNLRAIELVAK